MTIGFGRRPEASRARFDSSAARFWASPSVKIPVRYWLPRSQNCPPGSVGSTLRQKISTSRS